jgi:hypothetical protein
MKSARPRDWLTRCSTISRPLRADHDEHRGANYTHHGCGLYGTSRGLESMENYGRRASLLGGGGSRQLIAISHFAGGVGVLRVWLTATGDDKYSLLTRLS